jgi:hypothetical protein
VMQSLIRPPGNLRSALAADPLPMREHVEGSS